MKSHTTKKNIIYLSNRNSLLYFSIGAIISSIFENKLTKIEPNVEPIINYTFRGKNINTILFVFVFLILVKLLQNKKKEQKCNLKFCKEKGFCHSAMDIVFGMLGAFTILIISNYKSNLYLNMTFSFIPIILFIIFEITGVWGGFSN
tara:strand:- start:511 stop:951 length:441 start_codon:yes stop_codon:yes gene_type:complete